MVSVINRLAGASIMAVGVVVFQEGKRWKLQSLSRLRLWTLYIISATCYWWKQITRPTQLREIDNNSGWEELWIIVAMYFNLPYQLQQRPLWPWKLSLRTVILIPGFWRVAEHDTPKHATLREGLSWAEGKWKADVIKTLCPAPICLKAGYKFVKVYLLSSTRKNRIMRQL